jgi:hypothetical protein
LSRSPGEQPAKRLPDPHPGAGEQRDQEPVPGPQGEPKHPGDLVRGEGLVALLGDGEPEGAGVHGSELAELARVVAWRRVLEELRCG